jgi:hypothetical protein
LHGSLGRVLVTGEGSKVFDGLSVGRQRRFTARSAKHKSTQGNQTHRCDVVGRVARLDVVAPEAHKPARQGELGFRVWVELKPGMEGELGFRVKGLRYQGSRV